MSRSWLGILFVAAAAAAVPASAGDQQEERDTRVRTERPATIKVLNDAKEISSFYSSEPRRSARPGPYGLASYYRSEGGGLSGYYRATTRRAMHAWAVEDGEPCVIVAPERPYRR